MKEILNNYLSLWTEIWNKEMEIEKIGLRVGAVNESFGSFSEGLCAILFNAKGDSSSGMGYDLKDENGKIYEVKSCIKHKNKDCKNCGHKNVYVNRSCYNCGSALDLTDSTSRFGISSKKVVNFQDGCEDIIFVMMENIDWDSRKITIWTLNFSDKNSYFYNYALNQHLNSKSDALNLLPLSYDFLMAEPIKKFEILYKSENDELYCESIKEFDEVVTKISSAALWAKEINMLEDNNISSVGGYYKISDIKKYLSIRKKSLNKNRGNINRRALTE